MSYFVQSYNKLGLLVLMLAIGYVFITFDEISNVKQQITLAQQRLTTKQTQLTTLKSRYFGQSMSQYQRSFVLHGFNWALALNQELQISYLKFAPSPNTFQNNIATQSLHLYLHYTNFQSLVDFLHYGYYLPMQIEHLNLQDGKALIQLRLSYLRLS